MRNEDERKAESQQRIDRINSAVSSFSVVLQRFERHKKLTMASLVVVICVLMAVAVGNSINGSASSDEKIIASKISTQAEQEKATAEASQAAKSKAAQEEAARQHLATYGITQQDFSKDCQKLVSSASGSSDFGVLNDPGNSVFPDLGSMVTQKSVYSKNVYGAKVEEVYKCWSTPDGKVQAELIGAQVK